MPIQTIEDLTPDDKNANKGTERGNALLEHSLRQFGAGRSAVADKNGKLIAGNKTVEKAAELGIPIRPVHTRGHELVVVVRDDLDLDEGGAARELAYADNRVGEVSLNWDTERIAADVAAGVDLSHQFRVGELQQMHIDAGNGDDMVEGGEGRAGQPRVPTLLYGRWRFLLTPEDAARFAEVIDAYLAINPGIGPVHGWLVMPDPEAQPVGLPERGASLVFGAFRFPLSERECLRLDGAINRYLELTGTPDGFGAWLLGQLDLAASL